jgi:acyl-CoA synthetase (AMP-forming)/AMP-acid ligase II
MIFTLYICCLYSEILKQVDQDPSLEKKITSLNRVIISGSAAPAVMVSRFRRMGINVLHLWGMTEMSPIGSTGNQLPHKHGKLSEDQLMERVLRKAGSGFFNVEKRIVDDNGKELRWDGETTGNLQVRGPHVTRAYFRVNNKGQIVRDGEETPNVDENNWLNTGDIASIDQDGYLKITDRSKDVIKSGGEWISSIDIENMVVAHPAVQEACVVGHKHSKWEERPLLLVVKKPGKNVTADEIREYLAPKIAKWWMPNGIEFVNEIPKTATGKLSKLTVRKQFKDYVFPDDPLNTNAKPKSKL